MYLEDWIKKKNMNYKEFCEHFQIERTTLYYWLSGKKKPNANNMKKLKFITKGKVTYEELSKTQIQSKT